MRRPGKPNTFFKGMKIDMDPSAQPKDSYRYAKNIRLTAFEGKNVSLQPYDSDKNVLSLTGSASAGAANTAILGAEIAALANEGMEDTSWIDDYTYTDMTAWAYPLIADGYQIGVNIDEFLLGNDAAGGAFTIEGFAPNDALVYMQNNETIASQWTAFFDDFFTNNTLLPVQMEVSGIDDANSDGIGIQFNITLTTSDGTVTDIIGTVPPSNGLITSSNSVWDYTFENIIIEAINNANNSFTLTSYPVGYGQVGWQAVNNANDDTFITNISVSMSGDFSVSITQQGAQSSVIVQNHLIDSFAEYYEANNLEASEEELTHFATIADQIQLMWGNYVNSYFYTDTIFDNFQSIVTVEDAFLFDLDFDSIEGDTSMEVLGHYEFSDYLVLLGTWPAASEEFGFHVDFILKTTQKQDGSLTTVGEDGYQMFFVGNLEFTSGKKLKVVGAEESDAVRRIYFTDGKIPLRTINVGAGPLTYVGQQNNPGSFDLFVEANLSVPIITGFSDGGSLDSIAHAYAFRYKTKDGRYSKISPVCNPASVPVTNKSTTAAFVKGGNADVNSGKSISGVINNIDTRYDFVEMIYVPYIGGVAGTAKIFATITTKTTDEDGNPYVLWTHTGNEIVADEILIDQFGTDIISWDVCQALEVKDNRLFCGNLSGSSASVQTDFTVVSYNRKNEHHDYNTGNPHLYHDLLYSTGGLKFNDGTNPDVILPSEQVDGRYCEPEENSFLYRYIKREGQDPGDGAGLYTANLSAPRYWESWNSTPTTYSTKRGIFGAQSKYFSEVLPNDAPGAGENEGVRVTFRVLGAGDGSFPTPAPAIQLDKDNKLISSGGFDGARAPFYKIDSSSGGDYYANYANPKYNSNYVGYRRGEVYRFGLLFYDKKGQPMFVKPIGDIRMPEHSTEYITPVYGASGAITSAKTEWPFYFQTSRHDCDNGFSDYPAKNWSNANQKRPYSDHPTSKGPGQYGCVLYPYFEVKLSSATTQQISGYSIVRVERTPQHRTISASGVLQRAVKYVDNSLYQIWNFGGDTAGGILRWAGANRNGVDMTDKFGNSHVPFWTPTIQGYRSHRYGNDTLNSGENQGNPEFAWSIQMLNEAGVDEHIGGHEHWSHSNIYTIDSPDAILNTGFHLNFSSGDRLKVTESRYCIKEQVPNGGAAALPFETFFNSYLAEGTYPGNTADNQPSNSLPELYRPAYSIGLFTSLIAPDLLEGKETLWQGEIFDIGGWTHRFSEQDGSSTSWEADWGEFDMQFRDGDPETGWQEGSGYWLAPDQQGGNPGANSIGDDWYNLGLHAKFYSKRIGAYPMYGLARPDWNMMAYEDSYFNENSSWGGTWVPGTGDGWCMSGHAIQNSGQTFPVPYNTNSDWYTPQFLAANAWGGTESDGSIANSDGWYKQLGLHEYDYRYAQGVRATNVLPDIIANGHLNGQGFGERLDAKYAAGEWWNESNITFAKVVGAGEDVPMTDLGSDRDYRNATMWHDLHRQCAQFSLNSTTGDVNMQLGGNAGGQSWQSWDGSKTYCEASADYSLNARTIVLSLPNHGMLPITRHCLQGFNWRERIFWQFGGGNMREDDGSLSWPNHAEFNGFGKTGGGARWSEFSPEVTIASIVKSQSHATMYGGNSASAMSKNTYLFTGCFQQVNTSESFSATGNNGNHVFGGDTYVCMFSHKKVNDPATSRKHTVPDENVEQDEVNYAERGVLTAYTCPVETETNLDLRHGLYFGSSNADVPKLVEDDFGDFGYNTSYDSDNIIQSFLPRPTDFIEITHWPATIAFSEPKFPGDLTDSYAIFPFGQVKDLDYSKGPITQIFKVSNNLFTTQYSGTSQLQVNPRVMIPAGEGGAITTISGTDSVIERYDYISESLGSQHFHNLAISDIAAYYYDNNACKFIKLGRGKGGGWSAISLGETLGMQSFFNKFKNGNINDSPLTNFDYHRENPSLSKAYRVLTDNYEWVQGLNDEGANDKGGIVIGHDPEYGEVLLTLTPTTHMPETIVYNEALDAFSGFVSKRPSQYIKYKERLYQTYSNLEETSANKMYLSNYYVNMHREDVFNDSNNAYLNFGDVDYYVFGHADDFDGTIEGEVVFELEGLDGFEIDLFGDEAGVYTTYSNANAHYTGRNYIGAESSIGGYYPEEFTLFNWFYYVREPIQIQFVVNDEPNLPKVFDNIDIDFKGNTRDGANHLYFRKFAFEGSSNLQAFQEFDASLYTDLEDENGNAITPRYSGADIGFSADPGEKKWYNVKEGTHHIPTRISGYGVLPGFGETGGREGVAKGNFMVVGMTMGWDEGQAFFGETEINYLDSSQNSTRIKNEGFNILSITPYYRYSRR